MRECEVTIKLKLEWADSESEDIANLTKKIVCCECDDEDDD